METNNKTGDLSRQEQNGKKQELQNVTGKEKTAQKQELGELKSEANAYTSTQVVTYSSLAALIAGVLGYFIGQAQGEKKAKQQYEYAIEEWRKKMENRKKENNDQDKGEIPKFSLE